MEYFLWQTPLETYVPRPTISRLTNLQSYGPIKLLPIKLMLRISGLKAQNTNF